jgi:hypothetical protein
MLCAVSIRQYPHPPLLVPQLEQNLRVNGLRNRAILETSLHAYVQPRQQEAKYRITSKNAANARQGWLRV